MGHGSVVIHPRTWKKKFPGIFCITMAAVLWGVTLQAQTLGVDGPGPVTLAKLQDSFRPILIFAPSFDITLKLQIRSIARAKYELKERDVIVIPVPFHQTGTLPHEEIASLPVGALTEAEQAAVRKRFHIAVGDHVLVLIGKDGGEKFRSALPVLPAKLIRTIDAMPMRQDEMRLKAKP